MIERLHYYVELAITLCGFDGSEGNSVVGWIVIAIAVAVVIYAFYKGALGMLGPSEIDEAHIKYRILNDEDAQTSGKAEQYNAN